MTLDFDGKITIFLIFLDNIVDIFKRSPIEGVINIRLIEQEII